jgi:hypothetical protein
MGGQSSGKDMATFINQVDAAVLMLDEHTHVAPEAREVQLDDILGAWGYG